MQISFDRLFAKICNFFRKTYAIRFLMSKSFQKAKFYQNLTIGSGSKQRFSLLQEKAVIQASNSNFLISMSLLPADVNL